MMQAETGPDGRPAMSVQAELAHPALTVKVANIHCGDAVDAYLNEPGFYRLDLSLDRRAADSRLCFTQHWPSHRFERPGKLFILPPGQEAHVRCGPIHEAVVICRLNADRVREWFSQEMEWTRSRVEVGRDVNNSTIKTLLLRLASEASAPGFASALLAEAIGIQLAVELERYYLDRPAQREGQGLAPWRLRLIDDRLNADAPPPTLTEMATLCDLSVRQLSRAFRMSRGSSLGKYAADMLIDKAKSLLNGNHSIKSVAHSLNFSSASNFSSAFRRSTGVTPREYRGVMRRSPSGD